MFLIQRKRDFPEENNVQYEKHSSAGVAVESNLDLGSPNPFPVNVNKTDIPLSVSVMQRAYVSLAGVTSTKQQPE